MANFMQIIDVNTSGSEVVLHPETNADFVTSGATFKVPKIIEISDWNARSKELTDARKGESSLKLKIDKIDNALKPLSILEVLKTVDGSGSGLDADTVDGKTVDDSNDSNTSLWTAEKTLKELAKKVNNSDVVASAAANKILRLDGNGSFPASITKNSATTSKFINDLTFNFRGDVTGSVVFNGSERDKAIDLQVVNNSHTHNQLEGPGSINVNAAGADNIVNFKINNVLKSYITKDGKFEGDCASVNGYRVNSLDKNSLWTGAKVESAAREIVKSEVPAVAKQEAQSVVENELLEYAKKTENGISLGPVSYSRGKISISELDTVTISLPAGITDMISESYIITSSDSSLTFVKDTTSTHSTIKLNLSGVAPTNSTLSWYVASI